MDKEITCPACGQPDQVEKVSTLYFTALGLKLRRSKTNEQDPLNPSGRRQARIPVHAEMSRLLAPPSAGRQAPMRPIHPDLVLIAFTAIAPIFLYGIFTSQAYLFVPVLVVLAAAYLAYFWQRKNLITRFTDRVVEQKAANERIKRGIERWMMLYYCACEEGVFMPGAPELIPVDEMMVYLMEDR